MRIPEPLQRVMHAERFGIVRASILHHVANRYGAPFPRADAGTLQLFLASGSVTGTTAGTATSSCSPPRWSDPPASLRSSVPNPATHPWRWATPPA